MQHKSNCTSIEQVFQRFGRSSVPVDRFQTPEAWEKKIVSSAGLIISVCCLCSCISSYLVFHAYIPQARSESESPYSQLNEDCTWKRLGLKHRLMDLKQPTQLPDHLISSILFYWITATLTSTVWPLDTALLIISCCFQFKKWTVFAHT